MLVYDITNEKSFDNIKNWIRNIEEVCMEGECQCWTEAYQEHVVGYCFLLEVAAAEQQNGQDRPTLPTGKKLDPQWCQDNSCVQIVDRGAFSCLNSGQSLDTT